MAGPGWFNVCRQQRNEFQREIWDIGFPGLTPTGDNGSNGLDDGSRVAKDHAQVHAMGDLDELNSHLGVLLCETPPPALQEQLLSIQHQLFDLGGELCIPGYFADRRDANCRAGRLAGALQRRFAATEGKFILHGGSRTAALVHVCRTVCRRAERRAVALGRNETATTDRGNICVACRICCLCWPKC